MNIVDQKTTKLFKEWDSRCRKIDELKRETRTLECEMANAKNAFAKHLCPKNAETGEKFSIWIDGCFLNIEVLNNHSFSISWRVKNEAF